MQPYPKADVARLAPLPLPALPHSMTALLHARPLLHASARSPAGPVVLDAVCIPALAGALRDPMVGVPRTYGIYSAKTCCFLRAPTERPEDMCQLTPFQLRYREKNPLRAQCEDPPRKMDSEQLLQLEQRRWLRGLQPLESVLKVHLISIGSRAAYTELLGRGKTNNDIPKVHSQISNTVVSK